MLKNQLKKLKRNTSPRPELKAELWSKLSDEYDRQYAVPVRKMSWGFKFVAVGVTALVLLVSTGTGVYAYESPKVSEGHVLFPVKRGMERVQEHFARSPEAQAKFHAEMVRRRLSEVEARPDHVEREKILQYVAKELEMSTEELKSELVDPETRERIRVELEEHRDRMRTMIQNNENIELKSVNPVRPGIRQLRQ